MVSTFSMSGSYEYLNTNSHIENLCNSCEQSTVSPDLKGNMGNTESTNKFLTDNKGVLPIRDNIDKLCKSEKRESMTQNCNGHLGGVSNISTLLNKDDNEDRINIYMDAKSFDSKKSISSAISDVNDSNENLLTCSDGAQKEIILENGTTEIRDKMKYDTQVNEKLIREQDFSELCESHDANLNNLILINDPVQKPENVEFMRSNELSEQELSETNQINGLLDNHSFLCNTVSTNRGVERTADAEESRKYEDHSDALLSYENLAKNFDETVSNDESRSVDEDDNLLGILQGLSLDMKGVFRLCNDSDDLGEFLNRVENTQVETKIEHANSSHFNSILATASDDLPSSFSSTNISEVSLYTVETTSSGSTELPRLSNQSSNDNIEGSEDDFSKQGDADGSSICDEINKLNYKISAESESIDVFEERRNQSSSPTSKSDESLCERSRDYRVESGNTAYISAWNELRSSLRQLYRSMLPSSLSRIGIMNDSNRPSLNRIKALANMFFAHDPYQLFTRTHQLSQEFCIELKVRLLSFLHDKPELEEAFSFVKEMCESCKLVTKVSEVVGSAFERLDKEYLSHFRINWIIVNIHIFYSTIFTDPDVQDYLTICCSLIEKAEDKNESLENLTALKECFSKAVSLWTKAEVSIHDYAVERMALNAQHRKHFLNKWGFHNENPTYSKFCPLPSYCSSFPKEASNNYDNACSCDQAHSSNTPLSSCNTEISSSDKSKSVSNSCECHFCNSSSTSVVDDGGLSVVNNTNVLPPLSQPQLSLYPHIHGTSNRSDITSKSSLEKLRLSSQENFKPPLAENPFLGSDILTEQLIREWDMTYGDSVGASIQLSSEASTDILGSSFSLTNQMKKLTVGGTNSNDPTISCFSTNNYQGIITSSSTETATSIFPSHSQIEDVAIAVNSCSTSGSIAVDSSSLHRVTEKCTSVPSSVTSSNRDSERNSINEPSWSSNDETDVSGSDSDHDASHCNCCYCHMLQNKPGGGRQRYQDRRDRLRKILSEKKRLATPSGIDNDIEISKGDNKLMKKSCSKESRQSLDDIMDYIEGKTVVGTNKCPKKAAKRARQKKRKIALKKQAEKRKDLSDSFTDDEEDNLEDEDEEDGPLAELRRRAPDVTITVVKPGQQQKILRPQSRLKQQQNQHQFPTQSQQFGMNRDHLNPPESVIDSSRHPLASNPVNMNLPSNNSCFNTRPMLPSGRLSSMPIQPQQPGPTLAPLSKTPPTVPPTSSVSQSGGLSSLLKGMESLPKDSDADGKNQMVTIRRVMDPVSSEPTVTITLKGDEPKKDKVLFKLVNGQACPGEQQKKNKGGNVKVKVPQVQPVYDIPEGISPEEAKKMKKQQKKARQRQQKEGDKLAEAERERMKLVEIQKQKEFLKQQEAGIRKQQQALDRQHKELMRQQSKVQIGQDKNAKGGKSSNVKSSKNLENKNVSALVYEGDDVARNFSLPPGVSINKVAGQPGMVTISNNMNNHFPQPFLPNPNIYQGNLNGYQLSPHNLRGDGCDSVRYPGLYEDCSNSIPWNSNLNSCSSTPQESVIVVDTNSSKSTTAKKKTKVETTAKKITKNETKTLAINTKSKNSNNNNTTKNKREKVVVQNDNNKNAKNNNSINVKSINKNVNNSKKINESLSVAKKPSTNRTIRATTKRETTEGKPFDEMTSEEKVEAAVKGIIEPSRLNMTLKGKYRKAMKALRQEEEKEIQKQKEEDDLMDYMYEMAKNFRSYSGHNNDSKSTNNKVKKGESAKSNSQRNQSGSNSKGNHSGSSNKNDKNQNKKQKQASVNTSSKSVISSKIKGNTMTATSVASKKGSESLSSKADTKNKAKDGKNKDEKQCQEFHVNEKIQQQKLPKSTSNVQKQQPNSSINLTKGSKSEQKQLPKSQNLNKVNCSNDQKHLTNSVNQKTQQGNAKLIQTQSRVQLSGKQSKNFQNCGDRSANILNRELLQNKPQSNIPKQFVNSNQFLQHSLNNPPFNSVRMSSYKGNLIADASKIGFDVNSYPPTVGYGNNDFGHEARYAQYLAANASTLASVEYETNSYPKSGMNYENTQKTTKKKTKKGHLEDLTTIDSVFTPKELPSGELDDETDREVEAFKRFCLYNVPRSGGEKPKVNFNVKDILIKKKH